MILITRLSFLKLVALYVFLQIIGLSLLFVILTIANLAVFYGITAPGLAPTLRASILSYLINANVRSSWNRATNLVRFFKLDNCAVTL